MNIGIITQPILNNYGGLLQNYALQNILQKLGHNPITLNYVPKKGLLSVLASLVLTPFLHYTSHRRSLYSCLPVSRDEKFDNFINERLKLTTRVNNYKPYILNEYNLDAVIVGSDQVWRPKYNSSVIEDNFLAFTSGYNIKRLSYAASFGCSNWEYSEKLTKRCALLAQQFDAISVREKEGVEMCNKYLSVNAVEVLDPTLLLQNKDYECLINGLQKSNKKYLFTYILDDSNNEENIIFEECRKRGLERVSISVARKLKYSVEEWLDGIRSANLVLTDSFHGMVFSIIFKKNFIVICNKARGESRMTSLLNKLNLLNRHIRSINELDTNLFDTNIDWEEVNVKLNRIREKSLKYLTDSIGKKCD